MLEQKDWTGGKVVLHNFNWIPTRKEEPQKEPEKLPPPEPPKPEPVQEKPADPPKQEKAEKRVENIILVYCLPSVQKKVHDELYGESYQRMTYGEKVLFESVLVEQSDFEVLMWGSFQCESGSILYPSRYKDGPGLGEHRWWKVTKCDPYEGGFLLRGVPSSYQPDFS
jgi:hypothetical protein